MASPASPPSYPYPSPPSPLPSPPLIRREEGGEILRDREPAGQPAAMARPDPPFLTPSSSTSSAPSVGPTSCRLHLHYRAPWKEPPPWKVHHLGDHGSLRLSNPSPCRRHGSCPLVRSSQERICVKGQPCPGARACAADGHWLLHDNDKHDGHDEGGRRRLPKSKPAFATLARWEGRGWLLPPPLTGPCCRYRCSFQT